MARTDLIRLGFTVMDHYGSEPTIQGACHHKEEFQYRVGSCGEATKLRWKRIGWYFHTLCRFFSKLDPKP